MVIKKVTLKETASVAKYYDFKKTR